MRKGKVFLNHAFAGTITETPGEGYSFIYDDLFYADKSLPAISLTLPKTQKEYHSRTLFPFFSNMLSEGYNRRFQARLHHLDVDDDFGILLATAYCDTAGAVTVEKESAETISRLREHQSATPSNWRENTERRLQNKSWLRYSQRIAMMMLDKMEEMNMSQKQLSELMGCSQQYVSRVLKGQEDLSLEKISKIEECLGIQILST